MAVYLASAGDRLPPAVIYPGVDYGFDVVSNIVRHNKGLLNMKRSDGAVTKTFRDRSTDEAMSNLAAHMRTLDLPEVSAVFVQENLSRAGAEIELAKLLTTYFDEVVLVKVARRQDQLMSSQMVQFAKRWKALPTTLDLEDFVSYAKFDAAYLDLDHTLSTWEAVADEHPNIRYEFIPFLESDPGTENLHFRFFEVTGLTGMPRNVLKEGVRINGSLGHDEIVGLVRYKKLNARWGWIPGLSAVLKARHDRLKDESGNAIRRRTRRNPTEEAPRVWRINEHDAAKFLASFRDSNRRFLDRVPRHGLGDSWNEWASSVGA
jgi:hypothetical protein